MNNQDSLQRFIFENAPVRGEIVRLQESLSAIMQQHQYPQVIQGILGEMLLAASLLSASIKYEGRVTVQFQGKDRVRLLLAEANHLLELRGLAQWTGDLTESALMNDLRSGTLAILMEPEKNTGQRYQGIVEWQGDSLAESLENYFNRSEQLPTRIWFAGQKNQAAGLLIQLMPGDPEINADRESSWETVQHLTATLTPEELLLLDNQTLLQRLYAEEDVRLFSERPVVFRCKCSVARSENALRLLGQDEVMEALREKQTIVVTCDFCNREFPFDRVEVAKLFTKGNSDPSSLT